MYESKASVHSYISLYIIKKKKKKNQPNDKVQCEKGAHSENWRELSPNSAARQIFLTLINPL